MRRDELAARIDHTLLRPEARRSEIRSLAAEAVELGVASACVQSSWVAEVASVVGDGPTVPCSVVGFPSGTHPTEIKVAETRFAVAAGAREIDVVVHLGLLLDHEDRAVEADLRAVVEAAGGAAVKVIVESALLDPERLTAACELSVAAGADFVKTSTGFHPSGGASVEAVRLMREVVGDRARVKASGGIRTTEAALAMIDAGADRLGLSGTEAVLAGLEA